jgi:hypothetical protein
MHINGAAEPEVTHLLIENNSSKDLILTAAYSGVFMDETVPVNPFSTIGIPSEDNDQPLSTIVFNQRTRGTRTKALSTPAQPAGSIGKSQAVIPGAPMLPASVNPKIAVLNKTLRTLPLEFIYKGAGSLKLKEEASIAPQGFTNVAVHLAGQTLYMIRIPADKKPSIRLVKPVKSGK